MCWPFGAPSSVLLLFAEGYLLITYCMLGSAPDGRLQLQTRPELVFHRAEMDYNICQKDISRQRYELSRKQEQKKPESDHGKEKLGWVGVSPLRPK